MRFVADRIIKNRAYPALARHEGYPYMQSWREFGQHWPYTVPAEIFGHMQDHGYEYNLHTVGHGWYVIGLGFFDFFIDYFALLSDDMLGRIRSQRVRILFYYHEGDNPHDIKKRLDDLCSYHQLDPTCYRFVSGNTSADQIDNFAWFPDHELLYWRRNRDQPAVTQHLGPRPYKFLALSRTHKWWRALAMADLKHHGILDHSLWSYNTTLHVGDSKVDNPIQEYQFGYLDLDKFLSGGPYACDQLSADQHNDHSLLVPEHFTDTYCSIVFETHFDADGSGGTFLTEKTFKAIKHGHPFVIVGPPGSLAALRQLGYKTFDRCIDNLYDLQTDNTKRWKLIRNALLQLKEENLEKWFERCWPDIQHNQKLFASSKHNRLSTLFGKLGNL